MGMPASKLKDLMDTNYEAYEKAGVLMQPI
jgi:hypothetical protein